LIFKPILGRLYEQTKRYSFIAATSVPSESSFSIAGYIQRKERCRLSSKMLRFLILTKQIDKIENVKFKTK
jgi:hypothetical protein